MLPKEITVLLFCSPIVFFWVLFLHQSSILFVSVNAQFHSQLAQDTSTVLLLCTQLFFVFFVAVMFGKVIARLNENCRGHIEHRLEVHSTLCFIPQISLRCGDG